MAKQMQNQQPAAQSVADYDESLRILTKLARAGDVRAAIALASHLRRSEPPQTADEVRRRRELREAGIA